MIADDSVTFEVGMNTPSWAAHCAVDLSPTNWPKFISAVPPPWPTKQCRQIIWNAQPQRTTMKGYGELLPFLTVCLYMEGNAPETPSTS